MRGTKQLWTSIAETIFREVEDKNEQIKKDILARVEKLRVSTVAYKNISDIQKILEEMSDEDMRLFIKFINNTKYSPNRDDILRLETYTRDVMDREFRNKMKEELLEESEYRNLPENLRQRIFDDVVINSSEADGVEELIEKLTEKYS